MNTNQYEDLKEYSQSLLSSDPIDAGHDASHAIRVFELAKEISHNSDLNIDYKSLKIACLFHDLGKKGSDESSEIFLKKAQNVGVAIEEQEIISESILNHSMNKRPKSDLGKILFDADKLDTLNKDRLNKIAKAIRSRKMSERRKYIYYRVGLLWLRIMKSRLHFDYSKYLYDEKLGELLRDKTLEETATELNLDLKPVYKIVRTKNNLLNRFSVIMINLFINVKGKLER